MAPRHSWGGMASTQTKIDVKDEDIKAIQGNLAYRFKAAKSIYAKVEDLSLEPLSRDERFVGKASNVTGRWEKQWRGTVSRILYR